MAGRSKGKSGLEQQSQLKECEEIIEKLKEENKTLAQKWELADAQVFEYKQRLTAREQSLQSKDKELFNCQEDIKEKDALLRVAADSRTYLHNEIAKLNQVISKMRTEYSVILSENQEVSLSLVDAVHDLEAAKTRVTYLMKENTDLIQKNSQFDEEINLLKNQLAHQEEQLKKEQEQRRAGDKELADVKRQKEESTKRLAEENKTLQLQVERIKKENDDLTQELVSEKEELQAELTIFKGASKECETKLKFCQDNLEVCRSELPMIEMTLNLQKNFNKLSTQLAFCQEDLQKCTKVRDIQSKEIFKWQEATDQSKQATKDCLDVQQGLQAKINEYEVHDRFAARVRRDKQTKMDAIFDASQRILRMANQVLALT
jgi:chromosome segregation ATPase